MADDNLIWHEIGRKTLLTTPIFTVGEIECTSPRGGEGKFSIVKSNHWALVMPLLKTESGDKFIMVRQWRHGAKELSLEFPGGVVEAEERPEEGVARELREETGFRAGKISLLGSMNPNPAFMENTISFFLAEELKIDGEQKLDKDEFVEVVTVPVYEVVREMGKPPYIHALMAAALSFWLRATLIN
ncbi:MAG: NUDIX hydrolase [Spirochaetaceae bacterium]|jgi:8-oxo-dGTP pyrophosphatase MutT (NUDIX family)|nr:NUDIX hydrolase [Spirochaetaceae bacterium]